MGIAPFKPSSANTKFPLSACFPIMQYTSNKAKLRVLQQ
jgi:hypothetical protein